MLNFLTGRLPGGLELALKERFQAVPQNLKKRAAELERMVKERAEIVKRVLKDYREAVRATGAAPKGAPRPRDRKYLLKKRLDVERANAEYIQLQKELDRLRAQMHPRK